MYSPNDATNRCGSGSGGGEGGRERGGGFSVNTRQKKWHKVFCCFFLVLALSRFRRQGFLVALEVRLGLPGFENRVLFVKSPQSLPSLNNLVGGVPLSLPLSHSLSLPRSSHCLSSSLPLYLSLSIATDFYSPTKNCHSSLKNYWIRPHEGPLFYGTDLFITFTPHIYRRGLTRVAVK